MTNYNLDDLLRGLAAAVSDANQELTRRPRYDLEQHFTPNADGALEPKTTPILLPRDHIREGEDPVGVHDVPQAILSSHRTVGIDNVKLEFDCVITGIDASDGGPPKIRIQLGPDIGHGGETGRLCIQFRANEPAEGIARINDKLLKDF